MKNKEQNITRGMIESEQVREYETKYIGSIITALHKGEKVEKTLQADDFEGLYCGRIYEEIYRQLSEGIIPDVSTLAGKLSSKALPDNERIPVDIIADYTNFFSDANISFYESRIYEASKNRLFIKALQIAHNQYEGTATQIQ
jgi:replicative DNA helicase